MYFQTWRSALNLSVWVIKIECLQHWFTQAQEMQYMSIYILREGRRLEMAREEWRWMASRGGKAEDLNVSQKNCCCFLALRGSIESILIPYEINSC